MELIKQNTQTKIIKSLLVILLGSIILAISSKIKIPFYPVPMTMQTFVVLLIGMSFGYKIGLATISLYLIEGIIGLPVFSNSPERGVGLVYFTGPTMGYLIGFFSACFLASLIKTDDNYFVSGGRVLNVIGNGEDLSSAIDNAYKNIENIEFENMYYRTDIGHKGLIKEKS